RRSMTTGQSTVNLKHSVHRLLSIGELGESKLHDRGLMAFSEPRNTSRPKSSRMNRSARRQRQARIGQLGRLGGGGVSAVLRIESHLSRHHLELFAFDERKPPIARAR